MDYKTNRRRWIIWLIFWAVIVLILSTIFTFNLTEKLKESELDKVELVKEAYLDFNRNMDNLNEDLTLNSIILEKNRTVPIIVADSRDNIENAMNFGASKDTNEVYLQKQLQRIKESDREPIVVETLNGQRQFLYYKYSTTLRLLTLFPYFQMLLISAFLGVAFLGFRSANRAEKNYIWAGMAKETAHQLGTPISAILAWLEILKSTKDEDDPEQEIITELHKDVDRLNLIADRFSKIGSKPVLEHIRIQETLERVVQYMKRRAPRKVKFVFARESWDEGLSVWVNPHLFEWVLENIIRNALDAMDSRGNIIFNVNKRSGWIYIDISDTGKGIPANLVKKIFEPGYSTKKRGWGLGLSLARRIVENYHHGKIYVRESKPGEGTTFTIQLPESIESGRQTQKTRQQKKSTSNI